MKKLTLCIAILTITASFTYAQDDESSEAFHFGLKAGANFANVYDTKGEEFNADAKLGFAGGAFVSIPIGRLIGVQVEALFSQKGYQSSGSILGIDYKYTHTSNFLDIPFLFAVKPVPSATLLIGPQYSFLISEKNKFSNSLTDPIVQENNFENDNVRKNTLGFVIGGDLNIGKIVIGLRAGYDILHNNGDGTQTTPRYKNAYYQGTVGFRI
jgi:hypothetical protein